MEYVDTIVALATPAGRAGIGVVRVSGGQSLLIAHHIIRAELKPRYASYLPFYDGEEIIDQGIVLFFKGPHSFTGEDVVEFHAHGGPWVLDRLIACILQHQGIRLARAGEFTERAFLNGKLDLVQAESIADLINANSASAAKSAALSLQGEFSKKINALVAKVIELRMYIEASIDFSEEDLDSSFDQIIAKNCDATLKDLQILLKNAAQGALLRDGVRVVIAGPPNAGKSSLINCLSARDIAIVSDIPGTTRDILREKILLDNLSIDIIDTAGLRVTEDQLEQEGIKRAIAEIQQADIILFVVDSTQQEQHAIASHWPSHLTPMPERAAILTVYNKIDLLNQVPRCIVEGTNIAAVYLSVKTQQGIDLLITQLKKIAGLTTVTENIFIARRRHVDALQRALEHLLRAQEYITKNTKLAELIAEELRLAQLALSEITGEFLADDLLGKIFASFCIGK